MAFGEEDEYVTERDEEIEEIDDLDDALDSLPDTS